MVELGWSKLNMSSQLVPLFDRYNQHIATLNTSQAAFRCKFSETIITDCRRVSICGMRAGVGIGQWR